MAKTTQPRALLLYDANVDLLTHMIQDALDEKIDSEEVLRLILCLFESWEEMSELDLETIEDFTPDDIMTQNALSPALTYTLRAMLGSVKDGVQSYFEKVELTRRKSEGGKKSAEQRAKKKRE